MAKEEKKKQGDRHAKHEQIDYQARTQKYETDVENLKNKRID